MKNINPIKTKQMQVTPRMAEQWLKRNHPDNRPVSKIHVDKLVDEMLAGRWKRTHQGIAFNCDGTLHDGQHRLNAIVKSGVTVTMNVSTGLPVESMAVIDSVQRPRSVGDAAHIVHGIKSDHGKSAHAAAAVWVYHGAASFNKNRSRTEQIDFFVKHNEAISWALEKLAGHGRGVGRAAVAGCVARAYYTCKRRGQLTQLARFCEVLRTGERGEGPEYEETVIKLRFWLVTSASAGWAACSETYKKTAAVLCAFLEKRKLNRIHEVSKEPFPLPDDDGAADPEGIPIKSPGVTRREMIDFIREYGEPVSLADIAEYCEIARSKALVQVQALITSGVVVRSEKPGHYQAAV